MNKRNTLIVLFLLIITALTGCGISLRNGIDTVSNNKTVLPDTATDEDLEQLTVSEIQLDKEYISQNDIDKVEITAIMTDDFNHPVQLSKNTYSALEINSEGKVKYDFNYFGKHEVTIMYYKNGKCLRTQLVDIVLTSDEYNIGLLLSTLPPTYFTLLMTTECNKAPFNNKLPSILAFNRPKSYDWNNLYPNMFPNPFSDIQKLSTNDSGIEWLSYFDHFLIPEMQSYVGYLYRLNPKSKFHFYFCDYTTRFLLQLAYENNIPEDQFDVTFFSDGTGTYTCFTDLFGYQEDPANPSMVRYGEYKKVWITSKEKATKGDTSYLDDMRNVYAQDGNKSEYGLITAIVTDSKLNAKWIVNRKTNDTFGYSELASSIFLNSVNGTNLIAVNMYSDIAKNIKDDSAKLEKFKKLYKLNLEEMDKANAEGKKVMIFIGGRDDMANMRDYALFMINYTKKIWNPDADYAFFYKGHPGETYSEGRNSVNADILNYGVKTLDASIPAEMFLLFRPDVEMCGLSSTTFESYTHSVIPFMIDSKLPSIEAEVQTFIKSAKLSDGSYELTTTKDGNTQNYVWNPGTPEEFTPVL